MKESQSALERLLDDPRQGPESHPELFRLLRESTLVFLLPYHPEVMGTMSLGNGDALPKFARWKGKEGIRIPIFSSVARANEACKTIGAKDQEYAIAEIKGQQLFALIACQKDPIMINPACSKGTTYLDLNAVKMLADGSILQPMPRGGEQKSGTVELVSPADYPTNLVQPLFQFLRSRSDVKAAWLFRETKPPEPGVASYVFVLKAVGKAEQTRQDFAVVANSAAPEKVEFGVTLLDPENKPLVAITSKAVPFYAAPDYRSPSPLPE